MLRPLTAGLTLEPGTPLLLLLLMLPNLIMQQTFGEWGKLACGFQFSKWNCFLASHRLLLETFWVPNSYPRVQVLKNQQTNLETMSELTEVVNC